MDLSKMREQAVKLEAGVWLDYDSTVKLRIRPVGNRAYNRKLQQLMQVKVRMRGRRAQVSDEEQQEMAMIAAAHALLIDWSGVKDKGVDVPYTPDEGLGLFKAHSMFYSDVLQMATDVGRMTDEELDEAAGNSPNTSNGSSGTPGD